MSRVEELVTARSGEIVKCQAASYTIIQRMHHEILGVVPNLSWALRSAL
jgi:hypothetical protein